MKVYIEAVDGKVYLTEGKNSRSVYVCEIEEARKDFSIVLGAMIAIEYLKKEENIIYCVCAFGFDMSVTRNAFIDYVRDGIAPKVWEDMKEKRD
jgi:hypothetical protein